MSELKMEPQPPDDKLIVRYLLGELTEEEQTQLEEHAFSDSDYLQRVVAVEKDLIDEYARGELSSTASRAFELRFFTSEHRRRQIEFARAFAQVNHESPARESPDQRPAAISSWWNSLLLSRRRSNPALSFSLAAVALVLVIGGLWLFRQSMQSRKETAQAQATPRAIPSAPYNAAPGPIADQQAQNGPQPTPSPANRPAGHQTPQPVVASLLLLPGTSRGAENRPQLPISPTTSVAQLRVVLESGDDYKTYGVELRTISGKMVRGETGLPARPAQRGRAVILTLPANLLTTGDYELTLNGMNEQKRAEPLGYYYFSVRKE